MWIKFSQISVSPPIITLNNNSLRFQLVLSTSETWLKKKSNSNASPNQKSSSQVRPNKRMNSSTRGKLSERRTIQILIIISISNRNSSYSNHIDENKQTGYMTVEIK